ncbi:MAG: NADH:ubiquinone oxidoreductase subunit [Rickettsiales bacterium]|jgi:NADH-quinone oxidoreductase subunit N|nr:NADH:ubiquinone oxidoreductase subunit [Rickettsiales bacterium]
MEPLPISPLLPDDILAFGLASPEIFLLLVTLVFLGIGVVRGNKVTSELTRFSLLALLASVLILFLSSDAPGTAFGELFIADQFTFFTKTLVLLGAAGTLMLSIGFYKDDHEHWRFEFPILMLFAVIGMMMMVSANDLITLYMGLELQSLSLYVLASIHRGSLKSSEAGLKYFVLGALSSGIFLYGASMVYGFSGTTNFIDLMGIYKPDIADADIPLGLVVGLVLILVAFCFKISAVPFHMWTPDVYEGVPTPVTAFFAAAPKVAAVSLLVRMLMEPFLALSTEWHQVIVFVSAASMVVGALGALKQSNIKRLLAYSSIGHVGYVLMGVAAANERGIYSVLVYLTLYITMSIGAFACVMMMKRKAYGGGHEFSENIADLAGLAKSYPVRAAIFAIFMFSMAGIPPLAGFWGKLFVLQAAVEKGYYFLAVIGVLSSVISAFYYLRIVKVMYFDKGTENFTAEVPLEVSVVATFCALFNLLFFIYPTPLFEIAQQAARALLL